MQAVQVQDKYEYMFVYEKNGEKIPGFFTRQQLEIYTDKHQKLIQRKNNVHFDRDFSFSTTSGNDTHCRYACIAAEHTVTFYQRSRLSGSGWDGDIGAIRKIQEQKLLYHYSSTEDVESRFRNHSTIPIFTCDGTAIKAARASSGYLQNGRSCCKSQMELG